MEVSSARLEIQTKKESSIEAWHVEFVHKISASETKFQQIRSKLEAIDQTFWGLAKFWTEKILI